MRRSFLIVFLFLTSFNTLAQSKPLVKRWACRSRFSRGLGQTAEAGRGKILLALLIFFEFNVIEIWEALQVIRQRLIKLSNFRDDI